MQLKNLKLLWWSWFMLSTNKWRRIWLHSNIHFFIHYTYASLKVYQWLQISRQFLMMVKILDTWLLRFHEKFSDISYVLLSMITWWAPLGASKIIALIPDRENLFNAWWAPVGPSNISWNRMSMSFENIVEISRWFIS